MRGMLSTDFFNANIYRFIALFLDERSLCRWTQTCKELWFTDHLLTEDAWKSLCERRWLRVTHLLRQTGISSKSYKTAYHQLSFRKLPPRGKYTEKRHRLFGCGCSDGMSSWLYLDHSSDCRPKRKLIQGMIPVVTIRICIQNIHHDHIKIANNIDAYNVIFKDDQHDEVGCYDYKVLAFNGQNDDISSYTDTITTPIKHVDLSFLDSIVVSMDVECVDDIENEVDFLSSIAYVRIFGQAGVNYPVPHDRTITLCCAVHDEDDIWEHYNTIPPGLVVLKDSDESLMLMSTSYR